MRRRIVRFFFTAEDFGQVTKVAIVSAPQWLERDFHLRASWVVAPVLFQSQQQLGCLQGFDIDGSFAPTQHKLSTTATGHFSHSTTDGGGSTRVFKTASWLSGS